MCGAEEMALWFRAPDALPDEPGPIPSTHIVAHKHYRRSLLEDYDDRNHNVSRGRGPLRWKCSFRSMCPSLLHAETHGLHGHIELSDLC